MEAVLPAPSTMVVLSLSTTTFLAFPRSSSLMFSSLMPRSSVIALPPVGVAMSSSVALRRSPKPGAFTAAQCRVPRSLLTTRVARASPSMSSAMMRKGLPARATCSSSGNMSFITLIFFSWIRTRASSRTHSMRSASVTKYGERYPRSNCMPSTTSSTVSADLDSSTVITPSLPTFSMASAIRLPMVLSLLEAIVATCAISFLSLVDLLSFFNSSATASTSASMPRLRPIGLAPAVTLRRPSRKMAWASTVAVVVPSPAMSEVLEATSFSIWAPMSSKLSLSSISLATVTPSLVMVGLPNFLSITTLRPFGPMVALTADAKMLTPRSRAARPSSLNITCFGMLAILLVRSRELTGPRGPVGLAVRARLLDDREHVLFLHDQVLLLVHLDLGARVLAEEDPVVRLHVQRDLLAILVHLPVAHCDDLALLGLLLRGVGNDDAALLGILLFLALDEDPVVQRTNLHGQSASRL